ncbi:MAG: hypothetical protein KatS3mg014_1919 [Actinomycetota bacterium]|nr:MAG: hypothetical protein KatS3mg014_1919 [Actinomycetota bacterium]
MTVPTPAEVTRRRFLARLLGATAAVGVAGLAEPALAHGDEGEEDQEHGTAEEQPTSTRVRRWAMIIDLRKCDGCVELGVPPQCTQACIWARFVPEGQQWVEVVPQPHEDPPGAAPHVMPVPCMQCENAPCVNVCPVGATFHTPEGTVLIDQERCIGCRLCIAACPYNRRFFNWGDPVQPSWVKAAPYDVRTQAPALRGTVMKCDFCTDRLEAGGLPSCALNCPWGALYFGDLEEDLASNGREVIRISRRSTRPGPSATRRSSAPSPASGTSPGPASTCPGPTTSGS